MLYREVKRKLIVDISSGVVPPGGALTNETDLFKRFGVSTGTIYELYQNSFGVTVVGAEERVHAVAAESESGALLAMTEGRPALRIERIAFTFDQKPAEFRGAIVDTRHADYVSRLVGQST